jgi:hypothetical protein
MAAPGARRQHATCFAHAGDWEMRMKCLLCPRNRHQIHKGRGGDKPPGLAGEGDFSTHPYQLSPSKSQGQYSGDHMAPRWERGRPPG